MTSCLTIDITIADYYGFTYVYKRLCVGYFEKVFLPQTLLYRAEGFEISDEWIHNGHIAQQIYKIMENVDLAEGFTPEIPKEKRTLLTSIKIKKNY